ncbi:MULTISPECIES: hypothetical protein [unclassified Saccharibacter]|uniref:hypothetical protein n=1 Tax=unclassified Saccharibacter TaxID=2648722 RepID=UPI001322C246|nr:MULTISPECIES: hypothetical protein [unclassified Saccharibacter]MXV35866.1 hypothetical protein [Saccharibacter sp. EH611]MXV57986.1 hypothetical protein [Saccharibacter sp. EH70]MXV66381.1 hypothetical protein [Saccharibacter sp. EH60]
MTTDIDLCNRALMRLGTQSAITSFDDGSVEASVCASFYGDVLQSMLAHPASMGGPVYTWQWPRCVGTGLTAPSSNPRWRYEIALPSDSVRVLRVDNALTEKPQDHRKVLFEPRESFGEGMGKAGGVALVPVLFTDHQQVSVTYITQSVDIDHWPPAFRRAFWLSLAAAIATTLGIDGSTAAAVAQEAEREVARACLADQRVEVVDTEIVPDWLSVRCGYGETQRAIHQTDTTFESGFIAGNSHPPAPAPIPSTPPIGPHGVIPTGLETRDIANKQDLYIPADTPDSRAGILTIGRSPVGWRRPYHTETINANAPEHTGEYDL